MQFLVRCGLSLFLFPRSTAPVAEWPEAPVFQTGDRGSIPLWGSVNWRLRLETMASPCKREGFGTRGFESSAAMRLGSEAQKAERRAPDSEAVGSIPTGPVTPGSANRQAAGFWISLWWFKSIAGNFRAMRG